MNLHLLPLASVYILGAWVLWPLGWYVSLGYGSYAVISNLVFMSTICACCANYGRPSSYLDNHDDSYYRTCGVCGYHNCPISIWHKLAYRDKQEQRECERNSAVDSRSGSDSIVAKSIIWGAEAATLFLR